jgi:hypothetical protein
MRQAPAILMLARQAASTLVFAFALWRGGRGHRYNIVTHPAICGDASGGSVSRRSLSVLNRRVVEGSRLILHAHAGFDAKQFTKECRRGWTGWSCSPEVVIAEVRAGPAAGFCAPVLLRSARGDVRMDTFHLLHAYISSTASATLRPRLAHELTQRFTAEFPSGRLSKRTLMRHWSGSGLGRRLNHHVRRLVSEGTRPRRPGTPAASFKDPAPVIALLNCWTILSHVRRLAANSLNDIAKDHPIRRRGLRWYRRNAGAPVDRQTRAAPLVSGLSRGARRWA